jgi:hypothetical protein
VLTFKAMTVELYELTYITWYTDLTGLLRAKYFTSEPHAEK